MMIGSCALPCRPSVPMRCSMPPRCPGVNLVYNASGTAFVQPSQKTSVLDATNPAYARYMTMTSAGLMLVGANDQIGIGFADLVTMFVSMAPLLTWPPLVSANPQSASAVHNSTTAAFGVTFSSEIAGSGSPNYIWQYSTNNGTTWNNFTGTGPTGYTQTNYSGSFSAGTTTLTTTGSPTGLIVTPTSSWTSGGLLIRIAMTNASGTSHSASAYLTVT